MKKLSFLFLMIFVTGQIFASVEFMEILEGLNAQESCIDSYGACSSSIRSVRCAFESRSGEVTQRGNCSFFNRRGLLVAAYDQEALLLFKELIYAGIDPHFNGREFKISVEKVSCRKNSSEAESPFTCRVFELY